jgi:putative peptide zinc metalloprotease protein
MSASLFSTHWYRVAALKPVLNDATEITRHVYRGQPWYLLHSRLNGRSHRFNAVAYRLIGQMDGRRTVQQIWENGVQAAAAAPPTQDEVIGLLSRLHAADLLKGDMLPDTLDPTPQIPAARPGDWKARISNPFAFRFPLWDPDRFLNKWAFLAKPLFTRPAFLIWLLIVVSAAIAAVAHWPDLSGRLSDRLLSPHNLVLIWLVYPLMKILHEFGHGFAVKKWGGEVHEMGIVLVALTPIAYVDASASAAFPDKRQRLAVAGMGVAVELLLASLALFVWLNVENGLISALAFNVLLIGGASTLLINGNPLLHYDGYYLLSDLLEMPNLGERSRSYLGYLAQRYLVGIESAESPVTAPGEKGWFLVYGPLAFCYRTLVLVGLVLLVGNRFLGVGVLIALWGGLSLVLVPTFRTAAQFLNSPEAVGRRSRLLGVGGALALGVGLLLFLLPVPLSTSAQGVVWLPEQSMIRAGTDCEVAELLVPAEQSVARGAPLIRGVDPFLEARIEVFRARLSELYAAYHAQPLYERLKRKMILDDIAAAKADLQNALEKQDHLLIRSPARGRLVLMDAHHLTGRFVKKGQLLGYIIADHRPRVRAVIRQADIGLVRQRITGVAVRLADQAGTTLPASIDRLVPAGQLQLPAAALGTSGGGEIPVDPTDPKGLRPLDTIFQVDLLLPRAIRNPPIGVRAYVRFEHGTMPLAIQWFRQLRQLLLRRFYV